MRRIRMPKKPIAKPSKIGVRGVFEMINLITKGDTKVKNWGKKLK